ncbi:MAG: acetyl-CoA carboxylase, biotin carboxyl carrier protein [Ruminococcus sp.]|nr:acetyl-CoA carboxylase, biotin carboxyl carrier protein [Ruminococcus sp.]
MSKKIYDQFDMNTLSDLADLINEKNLGEITIVDGEKSISIKGRRCAMPPMPAFSAAAPATADTDADDMSGNHVKAPIVGTFYAAPSPNDKPFVSVGDTVKKGDTLYIIESMKVMNEVQSEFDGVVKKILVKNGESLEFDQTVMIID